MEERIRAYVDSLFRNTPPSQQAVELREELIQNLIEKYNDFITAGKSEEAAYNISIASIGDISGLLAGLGGQPVYEMNVEPPIVPEAQKKRNAIITAVAVCLYIISFVPVILFDGNNIAVVIMLLMIAGATGLLIYNSSLNKRSVPGSDTVVGDFQQWRQVNGQKQQIYSVISTVLTVLTIVGYLLISFATSAWYITWIIFIISAAVRKVVKIIVFEVIE